MSIVSRPKIRHLLGSAVILLMACPAIAQGSADTIKVRIIDARTGQPVTNESLNVALHSAQIGSVAMPTDKKGIITVQTGQARTIRILANMNADCRPRAELYTDYPIATIRRSGITTGNLCSSAQPAATPGELILFETPKTYVPTYPHPPASNLPHSDEGPQSQ